MRKKFPNETPEEFKARKRAYARKWYYAHKEQALAASSDWERRNRAHRTETQRRRRKRTGEKFEWDLLKRYGLTPGQYADILAAQGGGCALCGVPRCLDGRRLVVDHDHLTGRVRGILCTKCNAGIGMLGDTLDAVAGAVRYLGQIPDSGLGTSMGLLF